MKPRSILIVLAAIVVILAIGLAIVSGNVDSFRPKIQAELQQKLDRPVSIGHLGLRVIPLSVRVDGLTIGDDPSFSSAQAFATASKVYVSVGLFSLITGNPKVEDVVLNRPQIELIRNAQGVWNFSSLGGKSTGSTTGGNSSFTLDKLQIDDGRVAVTDALHHQPRSIYDHIDLKLTDFAQNKPFGVDLAVHLPGQGKQQVEFKGKVGPLNQDSKAAASVPPVVGRFVLDEVSLAAVNRFASGTLPANTDSTISGNTEIDTSAGKIIAKGDLKLDNTTIKGAKLNYPIEAKYDVSTDQALQNISLQSTNIALGPTSLNASGSVNNAATPAIVDMKLKTTDSSLTEIAKLAGALGVAFSPDYKIDGKLTVDLAAKGPVSKPELNGNISLKNVSAGGGQIKEPVSTPEIDLTLTPSSIVSNTFTARSGSTTLNAAFTLANYTSQDPIADITLRSSNAQVAEILNIAKAYGVSATQGMTGSGNLSIDVHAHGDLAHMNSLTYAGTGSLQNATITTPELTKPVAFHSANAQFSQNSVALSNFSATVGSSTVSGNLSAKNLSAPDVQFALTADKIDTDELQNLVAKTPASPRSSNKSASNQPSVLNSMTGGGTLSVNTIKAQDIVLSSVSTTAKLDHGVITLSPLSASAFNGKINGSLTADMRSAVTQCSTNAKLSGMDANALMSAVSSMKNELYGTLQATTNLKFAIASSTDLAKTLNGTVDFNLANGQLKNVNILNEVVSVSKMLGSGGTTASSSGSVTALKQFSGTLKITDGVATTDNLKAVMDSGSMAANGSLNLVNQGINMHMTATTAGLTLPVLVTGDTAHMHFAPDVQALTKMKLGGSAGGLLNGVLGGQQKQQQGKPTDDAVKSLLDAFGKKKK